MSTITRVEAHEILDCRLEPTLRVTVATETGTGVADVPCGRSRGKHEVVELRDGDNRYNGLGVRTAVANVNETIESALRGRDVRKQRAIDRTLDELDGTDDKSALGGNALTGVSLAVLKAAAASDDVPLYRYIGDLNGDGGVDGSDGSVLPIPFFDLIEGGELGASGLTFQEHQVVPTGAASVSEAIRMAAEVYYELGSILADEYGDSALTVGDEGGYTPADMTDPRAAFDAELAAIEALGYEDEFGLAADVAASHFYDEETDTYVMLDRQFTRGELIDFYDELTDSYPIVSLEDPLHEEDLTGFAMLTDRLDIQIVGDDLFVTDPDRVRAGVERGAANALLLKVNQVGTVSAARDAAAAARRNGYAIQVSERSGQTPDTWLAELAVGLDAGQIKTGVTRGERTEQYNRLLEIEADDGDATFPAEL